MAMGVLTSRLHGPACRSFWVRTNHIFFKVNEKAWRKKKSRKIDWKACSSISRANLTPQTRKHCEQLQLPDQYNPFLVSSLATMSDQLNRCGESVGALPCGSTKLKCGCRKEIKHENEKGLAPVRR